MSENSGADWVQEGLGHQQRGELDRAAECYQQALAIDPTHSDALHFLGMARFQEGSLEPAEELVRQSIQFKPDFAPYHYNLGHLLHASGRLEEALAAYRDAESRDPAMAAAMNERGRIYQDLDDLARAEEAYRAALASDPRLAEAHVNWGRLLKEQEDQLEALEQFEQALAKNPSLVPAHVERVDLLVNMGRPEDALRARKEAEESGVRHVILTVKEAEAEEMLGRLEAAADRLEAVLEQDPGQVQALFVLGPLAGRLGRSFPQEYVAEALGEPLLRPEARAPLAFSLGAYLDKQGEHDQAFLYWLEANQVEEERADPQVTLQHWQYGAAIRQVFTEEVTEALAENGYEDESPIFVVGTPRSGTTLLEQILASHSRVTGVGESGLVHKILREELADAGEESEELAGLTPERCAELGRTYMDRLRRMAPSSDRIVDKTPGNAFNLGLIRAILPEARIIYSQRDPLDAGVSMFSLAFTRSVEFSYDMETLGLHMAHSRNHMAHWQAVLPGNFLQTVPYEELVADPETYVQGLLDHCGLAWETGCLRFFETERSVATASQAQVRRPIYRSAVRRWQRYAHHLLPLARTLGQEQRLSPEACRAFASYSRLGDRQWERGQIEAAVRSFRRAMIWERDRRPAINARLGRALEAVRQYQEAEACLNVALREGGYADEAERGRLEAARDRCCGVLEGDR